VHVGDLNLPSDVTAVQGKDVVIASITASAAEKSEEASAEA
jgi:large subunit ribosomal protein L25